MRHTPRRHRAERPRRGVALPTVLLVVALLSLLIAAAFEGAARASAAARTDVDAVMLGAAAEDALAGLAASFPAGAIAAPVGGAWGSTLPAPAGISVRASIAHVSPAVYWATVEARAGRTLGAGGTIAGGRRRLNQLFAEPPLGVALAGAVVAAGRVSLDASVRIVAAGDTAGCPLLPPDSAIVVVDSAVASGVDDAGSGVVWRRDARAGTADVYARWRTASWDSLAAHADVVVPAGTVVSPSSSRGCTTSPSPDDWGQFDGAVAAPSCARRSAVVHALGDLELSGGSGAGVLLVEGALRLGADVHWSGLIVARGGVEVTGEGPFVSGAMLSSSISDVKLGRSIELRHSRCAVWRALAAAVPPVRVRARGWAELL